LPGIFIRKNDKPVDERKKPLIFSGFFLCGQWNKKNAEKKSWDKNSGQNPQQILHQ
jgi:hypothetical protein